MPSFAPHLDAFGLVHTEPSCPCATTPVRQQRWKDVAGRNVCITCKRRDQRVLYPIRAAEGRCRICGEVRLLTEEHIPPQAAFNWDTAQRHSGEEWLAAEPGSDLGHGNEHQGGISTYTLCQPCNSLTGTRYGAEYAKWATAVHLAFQSVPPDPEGDNDIQPHYYDVTVGNADFYPGRFVRQALSTMATVSGGLLMQRAPQLIDAILAGTPMKLPEEMGLYLAVFPERRRGRILPPMIEGDLVSGGATLLCDFMHYPFALVLVLAGREYARVTGADIGGWLEQSPDEAAKGFHLSTPIARCHTIFPGDYRSLAQLNADIAASSTAVSTETETTDE
jgi:hypothetical protein